METCKFCSENKKLIKSHVIPKCFYHKEKGVTINANYKAFETSPKNMLIEKLFCESCDNSFSDLEKYAYDFFYKHIPANKEECTIYGNDCYKITDFDYVALRKFIILMAYRVHLCSSIPFNLGKYGNIALDLLKNDSFDQNLFVPILQKTESEVTSIAAMKALNKAMFPFEENLLVLNFKYYNIGIITDIKDFSTPQRVFNNMMFNKDQILIPIDKSFDNNSSLEAVFKILQLPHNKEFVEKSFAKYKPVTKISS